MTPLKIIGKTRSIRGPDVDIGHEVATLDVLDYQDDKDPMINWMASAWIPSPEELELLNRGHPVILQILGRAHPVVAVSVSDHPTQTVPQGN